MSVVVLCWDSKFRTWKWSVKGGFQGVLGAKFGRSLRVFSSCRLFFPFFFLHFGVSCKNCLSKVSREEGQEVAAEEERD